MKLKNTFIHIISYQGVGKYTIAKEISGLTGAKVIDNHLANNPVFSVIDMTEEIPQEAWNNVDRVRDAMFDTIRSLSPSDYSFVFTHCLMDGEEKYRRILDMVIDLAKDRQATYVPVRLFCSQEENLLRIVNEQRKERLKPTNPKRMLGHRANKQLISIADENLLDLDNTHLSAKEAAEIILQHTENVLNKS